MSSSIDPSSSGSQSSSQLAWLNLLSTVKKNITQGNVPLGTDPMSANAKASAFTGPDAAMMQGAGVAPDGVPPQSLGKNATGPVKENEFVDSFGIPKPLQNGPTMEMRVLMQDHLEKASQITTKDVKEITNLQSVNPDTTVGVAAFLPIPTASVHGDVIKKDMGFLALLGLVLTLLAKANSRSWSEQFTAQNSEIQSQLALAPQIGDAIRAQAAAQSDATLLQAQQQLVSGVMNICAFAAAGAMGVIGVATESSAKLGSAIFTKETAAASAGAGAGKGVVGGGGKAMDDVAGGAGGASGASKATQAQMAKEAVAKRATMQEASAMKASKASDNAESSVAETVANAATKGKATKGSAAQQAQANSKMTAQKKAEQQLDGVKNQSSQKADSIDDALNNPQWKEKMSRGFEAIKSSAGKGVEKMGIFLDNASKVAMLSNLLVQGVDGIAGSIYQTQIAAAQLREGEAQAVSTTLQQISNVHGQLAGQAQSLGEQSMQNMNQALQLLQNAADSSTSTTASIFH